MAFCHSLETVAYRGSRRREDDLASSPKIFCRTADGSESKFILLVGIDGG